MGGKMKGALARQFSFANVWDRLVRVIAVGAGWIAANGVPQDAKTWAAFVVVLAGSSYTGEGTPTHVAR